ncbi:MAG: hypothetical protein ABIU95_15435, partial [Burkholderiales bacterium]
DSESRRRAELEARITAERDAEAAEHRSAMAEREERERLQRADAQESSRRELEASRRTADADKHRLEREVAEERARREEAERKARDIEKSKVKERAKAAAEQRREERQREKSGRESVAEMSDSLIADGPLTEQARTAANTARVMEQVAIRRRRWPFLKIVGGFVGAIVVVGASVAILKPLDKEFYERIATAYIGMPVKIDRAKISLTPPGLQFTEVTIGAKNEFRIGSVLAIPELASMMEDRRTFTSVTARDVSIPGEALAELLTGAGKPSPMRIARLAAEEVRINTGITKVPPLNIKARMDAQHRLREIEVVDVQKTLTAQVKPRDDGGVEFELQSKSFEVPFGATFFLADFGMKGHFARGELTVKEFDARLFDGVLKGVGRLTAADGWTFEGQVEARTFELNRIAPAIFTSGRVHGQGAFTMNSDSPTTLFANPTLKGRFTSTTGQFTLVDLGRSIQSGTPQGGSTVYQEMQGELEIAAGRVLVKNTVFSANSLAGAATADIDQKGALFGRVGGELRTPAGQARSAFLLTGTLDKPVLKGGGAR